MDTQNIGSRFQISDLDDFLAPAQDCVVQLMTAKPTQNSQNENKQGSVQIQLETDLVDESSMTGGVRPDLIKKNKDNVATISLSDCLACNGCVTTAETMLIQQHSTDKFEELLKNCDKFPVVVSISQQSLYSLCVLYKTTPSKLFKVISITLSSMGVSKIYDLSLSQQLVLSESYKEFNDKYKQGEKFAAITEFLDTTKGMSEDQIETEAREFKKKLAKISSVPVLCSECPGWVCYAEKVVGDVSIPYMSVVKSPQQIQGYLLKKVSNKKLFTKDSEHTPNDIMHVCVMPWYDKKLEAVRPAGLIKASEDISDETTLCEVDAVLATHELADLFKKHDIDIEGLLETIDTVDRNSDNFDLDVAESQRESVSPFYSTDNTNQSSNGYSEYLFKRAAKEIFDKNIDNEILEYKQCRNKDFNEVSLEIHGVPVMKFALAYGFRNIQNIIRNIKRKKWMYDYVEIMACPGGCLNGGGQIKPKELNMTPADLLKSLIEVQKESLEIIDPNNLEGLVSLYSDFEKEQLQEMITTAFNVIKSELSISNLKW